MSTFGTHFRVTTFGESHCFGVGCIIDGYVSLHLYVGDFILPLGGLIELKVGERGGDSAGVRFDTFKLSA